MKTAKELELNLLVKEAHIQQLKLKNQELLSDNRNIAELNIKLFNKINKAIEYIMSELITEYDIKYGGNVRGSDLPVEAITPILGILKGEDNE